MAKYAWQEKDYHLDDFEKEYLDDQNKKYNQSNKSNKPSRQKVSDGTAKYQKDFTPRELEQRRQDAKERAENHINSGGTYQREDGSIVDISTSAPANVNFDPVKKEESDTDPATDFTDSSGSGSSTGSAWDMVKTPGSSFNPYEATNSFNPYA